MMFPAFSRFRSIGIGFVVACASLVFSGTQAKAEEETTGDNWPVGASAGNNSSVGIATTVDVPAPTNAPTPTLRHSTSDVPVVQPQPAPAQPAPAPAAPNASTTNADYEDADPSALEAFRPDLDPYGRWIDDSRYGRVWVPDSSYVGSNFAPYVSNGHWALDADNNGIWESDYPFGWAVFHYGRWVWIDSVGWSWIPGRRYAPAWVVWRVPTDEYAYVGWAPAPPTYVWFGTGVFWLSYYPPLPFVFCPSAYVFYPHFGAYLVRDRYFAGTLVRHSVWYSTAPIYGRGYASPPISRARIPANAVPSQRVSANPRAAAMARSSANPSIASRGTSTSGLGSSRLTSRPVGTVPGGSRPSTTLGSSRPAGAPGFRSSSPSSAPSYRSNSTSGGYYNFSSRPRDSYGSTRQVRSLGSMPSSSYGSTPRPAYSAPSGGYSSPRSSGISPSLPRSASPSTYSSPRYSTPSTFSAPRSAAPSYSAPSYSAPSRSYSAPSHSFSGGGGFRSSGGGGGGFRSGGGGRHR